jgi:hypothetical protein
VPEEDATDQRRACLVDHADAEAGEQGDRAEDQDEPAGGDEDALARRLRPVPPHHDLDEHADRDDASRHVDEEAAGRDVDRDQRPEQVGDAEDDVRDAEVAEAAPQPCLELVAILAPEEAFALSGGHGSTPPRAAAVSRPRPSRAIP